jgi:hypothetical protein
MDWVVVIVVVVEAEEADGGMSGIRLVFGREALL